MVKKLKARENNISTTTDVEQSSLPEQFCRRQPSLQL